MGCIWTSLFSAQVTCCELNVTKSHLLVSGVLASVTPAGERHLRRKLVNRLPSTRSLCVMTARRPRRINVPRHEFVLAGTNEPKPYTQASSTVRVFRWAQVLNSY